VKIYDPAIDPEEPVDPEPVKEITPWGVRESATQQGAERANRDGHYEDLTLDMNENELSAGTGQVCRLCHRVIAPGQDVRRRIDGTYQHEVCPPR
jgi:hypothetical protein